MNLMRGKKILPIQKEKEKKTRLYLGPVSGDRPSSSVNTKEKREEGISLL
jgi:hypothetical protein